MKNEKNKLKEYERNYKAANINKNRFHGSTQPIVLDSVRKKHLKM